tara:strand:+ start:310 stop:516 length:207 start_codon:yes stop_codon:yes gene_type:complete
MLEKIKRIFRSFSSNSYWEHRYETDGNSGAGSYNELAEFKASVINEFLLDKKVKKPLIGVVVMAINCH